MFLNFLNKAYPYIPSQRSAWLNNFLIGCFVALFLILFQPFNLPQWQTEHKILKLIGFGLVSFLVPTFFGWLVFKVIPIKEREDNWKVWKEIVIILGVLLSIALGNLFYANWIGISEISLHGFLNSSLVTMLLGLFPISLAILNKYHRLLRLNLKEAELVNSQIAEHASEIKPTVPNKDQETSLQNKNEDLLCLIAENQKDKLEIAEAQLLYIESLDNYSNIVYTENGTLKKMLLRSSLKRLESQIQNEFILRCHRSFLVNLHQVKKVEGNAAGYRLGFSESEFSVPVSRNFVASVMAYLKK